MKTKRVVTFLLTLSLLSGLVFFAWQRQKTAAPAPSQKIQVVASFYPLAEFARQVGGELVQVTPVVPADSEPHEYEPTPQEHALVYNASAFLYNGSGLDPWAERIAPELKQKGVRVVNMSEVTPLLSAPVVDGEEPESQFDPHFWLDPVLAQKHVEVIHDTLVAVNPADASTYQRQADAYREQLQKLDQEYQSSLASCKRREIVTSHAAFGYLAKRYNLSVINITGISPEEEPSARTLSEITRFAKQKNIQYIFFETLVSPKLAQTIASEIGAKTLVFNPIEGLTDEERQAGKDYLSLMRDNLQNLRLALECR